MDFDIITSNKDAVALGRHLNKCQVLGFDSETDCTTDSFDWQNEKQLFHQYSDGKKAYIVDLRRVRVDPFKDCLENKNIVKIIQDSSFDATWTAREHSIYIRNIHDTRYQEQILLGVALPRELRKDVRTLLEPKFSASLKHQFARRGWPDKTGFEPMYPLPWEPSTGQINYMVHDVDMLHELRDDQLSKLSQRGLLNLSILENEVAVVTYNMMLNGFGINVEGWMRFTQEEERYCNNILGQLKKIAAINWGSWAQYCRFFGVPRTAHLNNIHGPDFWEHDGSKMWKALQLFRLYQERKKNVTTYGRSFLDQFYRNGLVRSKFTQIVNTGRFASAQPDLQNIPSTTPHKSFMIPGHGKFNVFVRADFSGQEMAIIAFISQEPSWLKCLREGGDLHTLVASTILRDWNSWSKERRKTERRIIKIINFSIAYGAGVDTIALRAGTTSHDISMRLGMMQRAYPKVFAALKRNANDAALKWVSRSLPPFNRYRSLALEPQSWRRENIGKNTPVQGTAADMAKLALVYLLYKIDDGLPGLICHMEHDELLVECHRDNAEAVKLALEACMNQACTDILGEPLSQPELTVSVNWDKRRE